MTQQEPIGFITNFTACSLKKCNRTRVIIYKNNDKDLIPLYTSPLDDTARITELENEIKALEINLKRSNRLSKQRRDIIYMMSKNNKDTLKGRLAELEIVCDGLSQDAIEGNIELARKLCVEINGKLHPDDDKGNQYGSVEIAEILSAEFEKLKAENIALEARIANGVRVITFKDLQGNISACLCRCDEEPNATLLLDEEFPKTVANLAVNVI